MVDAAGVPATLRREEMASYVGSRDFTRVADLSARFGISEVTVRSDLDHLERRGRVRRVRGGALPGSGLQHRERPFEEVVGSSSDEKEAIGRVAAAMVSSGETVLLDVGTTTYAVARAMVARPDLAEVVVITNALNIALAFEGATDRFSVVVTGGTLRPLQHSLVDPYAGFVLDQIHAHMFFMGCNGVHPEEGVTNVNLPETAMKHRMLRATRRTVVVADGSKLGEVSVARVCDLDEVDLLVTGSSAPELALGELRDLGLDIQVAE